MACEIAYQTLKTMIAKAKRDGLVLINGQVAQVVQVNRTQMEFHSSVPASRTMPATNVVTVVHRTAKLRYQGVGLIWSMGVRIDIFERMVLP